MRKVILIFRKPFAGYFSIEYLFHEIAKSFLKEKIDVAEYVMPKYSKGLYNRVYNVFSMLHFKKKIVHVTGDVHYTILGAVFSKRILTIHDFSFMRRHTGLGRWIYHTFWIYLPVKFANYVTVISEATRKELFEYVHVKEEKVRVIPDFIDEIFKPAYKDFNSQTPRLLQIGTSFNKNIFRLAEALESINCELIIIGTINTELESKLRSHKINYQNKCNLTTEELYKEYTQADMLCYVSTIEGFGMPILEAQSTGIPVITSDCSSMPEVGGKGALYVDPLSIESIRKGITKCIEDESLRAQLKEDGFENIKRFSKENVVKQYISLYKMIA